MATTTPQPKEAASGVRKDTQLSEKELLYVQSRGKERSMSYSPSEGPHEDAGTNMDDSAHVPERFVSVEPSFTLTALDSVPPEANIADHDVHLLHKAHHIDPFSVLGAHCVKIGGQDHIVVRAWVKDARELKIRAMPGSDFVLSSSNQEVPMEQRADWLFQKVFKASSGGGTKGTKQSLAECQLIYELTAKYHGDSSEKAYPLRDAYNFGTCLDTGDLQFFQSGSCWHVDNLLGSHLMDVNDATGVRFAVWAPNAVFVSVVGDWNGWDGRAHPMRKRHEFGVWELYIPGLKPGLKYGYRIHSKAGHDFVKIDPYAQEFENPPAHASIISSCDDAYKEKTDRFEWDDAEWMLKRQEEGEMDVVRRQPMSIYEVHLPSWMRGEHNEYIGYRDMAHRLVTHVKALNFTHVEFLPLTQHPFEGSWGYQITGLYAPYSRLGNPDDLKYLINELHKAGIGVFIDFVPAHFCKDDWGLVYYDGEPCYEYADPREGENQGWGTMVFNFRRAEVRSFLLGACYHWLRRYHVDGLRIDAVSAMLYKNYCRTDWIPNEFGGDANLEAISLLQELNWVVHKEFPGVFTMAEESTSWQGVTNRDHGLGFDAKWDLGWMNDTLAYLCAPGPERHTKHDKLTFRGLYVAHEKWVLPLSHDEVVNGKGSLLDKCGFAGTPFDERLRTMRALFGFQIGLPGRPLIFMGAEIAQGREWKEHNSVDWHEGEEDGRKKNCIWLSDLLAVYKYHPALHAGDDESWNFQWIDCDNRDDCLLAFLRKWGEWYNDILVVINWSGKAYWRYPIGVPHGGEWEVLLNSDDWRYGGTMYGPGNLSRIGTTQGGRLGWPYCLWMDIPPFSALFLRAPQPPEAEKAREEEAAALEQASELRKAKVAAMKAKDASSSSTSAPAAVSTAANGKAAAGQGQSVKANGTHAPPALKGEGSKANGEPSGQRANGDAQLNGTAEKTTKAS